MGRLKIYDGSQWVYVDSSAFVESSSFSTTASYALNGGGGGTSLTTGSIYPITSSWSVNSSISSTGFYASQSQFSVSSSFASKSLSSSFSETASYFNQKWINTGSAYPITSSWSVNALTASSINFVPLTSTSSSFSITASYFNQIWLNTGSTYLITSSWAEQTTSSSYSLTSSYALNGGGSGTSLTTGSTYPITSSWSEQTTSSSYSLTSSYSIDSKVIIKNNDEPLDPVDGQLWYDIDDLTTPYVTIISSSYSSTASYFLNGGSGMSLTTGSFYPITSSWSENSVISNTSLYSSQSQFSVSSSFASRSLSSSFATTASYFNQLWLNTGSTYLITSSWSEQSISSSYSLTASYALNGGGGSPDTSVIVWMPAGAMVPQITGGPEATTQEFQSGSLSGSINVSLDGWLFDSVLQESLNLSAKFPTNWDTSSLTVQFYWTSLTGSSGTVEWAIRNTAFNDADLFKITTMSDSSSISQSLTNSASLHITPALPISSMATNINSSSLLQFNILRNVQTDTFMFDAMLLGVQFTYTTL